MLPGVMKGFLIFFHFILGVFFICVGVAVIDEYWKTPALFFIFCGSAAVSAGVAVWRKCPWGRLAIGFLVSGVTAALFFLIVGSIVWAESSVLVILAFYGVFLGIELAAWRKSGS